MIDAPFFRDLRTASWRNVPFGVEEEEGTAGRKNVVHNYPDRDLPWVEDMGKQGPVLRLTGFLVEGGGDYGGTGSVLSQRERMLKAVETAGDGELVHPTMGHFLDMALLDFHHEAVKDQGGVIRLRFTFMRSGNQIFPSVKTGAAAGTIGAVTALRTSAATSFASQMGAVGMGQVQTVTAAADSWSATVRSSVASATSLLRLTANMKGDIGRYVGESLGVDLKVAESVSELIGAGSAARQATEAALASLKTASGLLNIAGISSAVFAVSASVLNANPDPRQAVASLTAAADAPAKAQPTPDGTATHAAMTGIFRAASVAALAESTAIYQPVSYDDAAALRATVTSLIDAEMLVAGDAGLDDLYSALQAVKTSVTQDLTQRMATKVKMMDVTMPLPMPSLVLAQRLYQDASREGELVLDAGPIHPAFMPPKFRALAR